MLYQHLRSRGFQEDMTGPVIFKTNIIVPLTANKADYKLEENSPIERSYLVGLYLTKAGTVVNQTETQAAGAILQSAYLKIMVNTQQVMKNLYLHQIEYHNQQGRPFYLYLPGRVNLSETELIVPSNSGIAANTVIEIQADYAKLKGQQ